MSKKPKNEEEKKRRINVSLPGWIFDYVDENRGDLPRSTFITSLLSQIIKQKKELEY